MSIAGADRPFVTEKWQWRWTRRLPFDPQPPLDDPRALSRFFEGRDEEMERAVRTVFYGQNLMVRGSWGIGKTAFILSLIQRLSGEVEEDRGRLLAVYRPLELARADLGHFYRAILYGLCRALAAEDPQARRVLEALTGLRVTRERAGEAKTKVKAGSMLAWVVDVEGEVGGAGKRSEQLQVDDPRHHIDQLLERARKRYDKVVIALDDLDKKAPGEVRSLLDDAKALLRGAGCQFVLTGRSLVAPADDFSALVLDLFQNPIRLGPLGPAELERAAIGQVNLFRKRPADHCAPFTSDALAMAAGRSQGIPRLFNRLCREALIYALSKKIETISPEVFAAAVEASQNDLTVNVPYEQRRLLYLILARQGISFHKGADIEDLLREAEVQRMWDLLPMLDELVKKDWLYMVEEGGRMVIKVSPLAERAAELGRGQP